MSNASCSSGTPRGVEEYRYTADYLMIQPGAPDWERTIRQKKLTIW